MCRQTHSGSPCKEQLGLSGMLPCAVLSPAAGQPPGHHNCCEHGQHPSHAAQVRMSARPRLKQQHVACSVHLAAVPTHIAQQVDGRACCSGGMRRVSPRSPQPGYVDSAVASVHLLVAFWALCSVAVLPFCGTCSFISRESSPLLWASTYQAGEHVGDSSKLQEVSFEGCLAAAGILSQMLRPACGAFGGKACGSACTCHMH